LLVEPIRKDDLQAPILDQRFDSKFQELSNPLTSETYSMKRGDIVQQDGTFELVSISSLPCRNAHP
jgi:hypothetical protein